MRVIVAEDSGLVRQGLAQLLTDEGMEVTSQVDNADDLLRRVAFDHPDVAIVDIRMPPTHSDEGLVAAEEIRDRHPNVGVLLLSQYVESEYALKLLRSSEEPVGYLLKDRVLDAGELADAVRRAYSRHTEAGALRKAIELVRQDRCIGGNDDDDRAAT